jgi:hypothetical protein
MRTLVMTTAIAALLWSPVYAQTSQWKQPAEIILKETKGRAIPMQEFKGLPGPEPLAVPMFEPLVLPTQEEGLLTRTPERLSPNSLTAA